MPEFITEGSKIVQCRNGHKFSISLKTICTKCPICGIGIAVGYFGTIGGKFH